MKKINMKWVIKDSDGGQFFRVEFLKFPKELRGSGALGKYQKGKQTVYLKSSSFPEITDYANATVYEFYLMGTRDSNLTNLVPIRHKEIIVEALKAITKCSINVTRRRIQ